MFDKFAVPAITFLTTYFESLGGVLEIIPGSFFRPVQAFAGAFLGSYLMDIIGGNVKMHTVKYHAIMGMNAAIGALVGGVIANALEQNVALFAAGGAAIAVSMYQKGGMISLN